MAIWSPVSIDRYETEARAELALKQMKEGKKTPVAKKQPVEEKSKVNIDRTNLPLRSQLRIVKLVKEVFVIEKYEFGKWKEVKTFKTRTKAEEWCAINSRANL